jgi:hypothetical protein
MANPEAEPKASSAWQGKSPQSLRELGHKSVRSQEEPEPRKKAQGEEEPRGLSSQPSETGTRASTVSREEEPLLFENRSYYKAEPAAMNPSELGSPAAALPAESWQKAAW